MNIFAYSQGEQVVFWDEYYQNGIMVLGRNKIGDLRNLHIHPSEEWSVQTNLIRKSCDEKDFQPNVGEEGKNDPKG